MLVTLNDILKPAQQKKYAVPAFNTYNLEVTQAIIKAAEIERSPVILSLSEKAIEYAGLENITELLIHMVDRSKQPVAIHLDHGRSFDLVKRVIKAGFTSVMFDGSMLSHKRNCQETFKVCHYAHQYEVSCEGEIGMIGGQEDDLESSVRFPTVKEVVDFAQTTQVDALAVGLGTAHGLPVKNEHIEYELLEDIVSNLDVPIVLHGASNLTQITLQAAIKRGIAKINFDTELRQAFTQGVREILADKKIYDPRVYLNEGREQVFTTARQIIRRTGANSKA